MRAVMLGGAALAMMLGGCAEKTPTLPDDPIDKAASCGAIAAASERAALGVKGDLSADAQARILHYAMLAGAEGPSFDTDKVNQASQREPQLFDTIVKGKWETLKPACAAAYPATAIAKPELPAKPRDAAIQCDALTGFLRKALGSAKGNYAEALTDYGVLADKLSTKVAQLGKPDKDDSDRALAAVSKLGPPPLVIAACKARFAPKAG